MPFHFVKVVFIFFFSTSAVTVCPVLPPKPMLGILISSWITKPMKEKHISFFQVLFFNINNFILNIFKLKSNNTLTIISLNKNICI